MLGDSLSRFIAEKYSFSVRERIAHSAEGFSRDMWRQFAELGTVAALFPEDAGGFGGDGFDTLLAFECLGRGLVVEPFLGTLMVGRALARAKQPRHTELLRAVASGEITAVFAHDEANAHYILSHVGCSAVQVAGGWRLSGKKCVVRHGENVDLLLVSARTSGRTHDTDGISLFLLHRNSPGIVVCGYPATDGGRAADILLDDVRVTDDALVGDVNRGLTLIEHAVGHGILALCSEALGAMDAARAATLEFLQTRKQFGVPLGSFQALQHRMATLLLEIEQSRSAVINAAAAMEGRGVIARERAISAAKFTVSRVGTLVAEECIQMHGGIGMTWELPLAHIAKRLVMIAHQYGDEDHHLDRFITLGRSDQAKHH